TAIRKLSGVALPSCCSGSSQRGAILVCHASTILPPGTILAAAWAPRTKGSASAVVANVAPLSTVRRVSFVVTIPTSLYRGVARAVALRLGSVHAAALPERLAPYLPDALFSRALRAV